MVSNTGHQDSGWSGRHPSRVTPRGQLHRDNRYRLQTLCLLHLAWVVRPVTEMRALLTPGADGVWHLRLRPVPAEGVPGLDGDGEYVGLAAPDYNVLDRCMIVRRAGYMRGLQAGGLVEITTSSDQGRAALCHWVTQLVETRA